jgi:hypothetical protein
MKLDRTNQLLLATVVILGVIAGLRFLDSLKPPAALWSVDGIQSPSVLSIEYVTPEGTLRLARSDSGWLLELPRELPADTKKVDTFLRDWTEGFAPDLRLDPRPSGDALEQFGLDDAHRSELRIEGNQGTLAHVFVGKTIAGGSHYLVQPGEPSVYRGRVPGVFRLAPDADEWRDKRLFPFEKDDLSGLVLQGGKGDFEFARAETTDRAFWTGVRPEGFEPASRSLDAMGRSLGNLKAQRILEGDEAEAARADAGLADPTLVVRATTESGRVWLLRFGAEETPNETVWASIDDDPRLFVLPKSIHRQFDKDLDDLRDKTVVHFRRDEEPTVQWSENERIVRVSPDGQRGWTVLSPPDFAPDPQQLSLAANSLLNLQATEVLFEEHPRWPKAGPRIEIITASGTKVVTISPEPDEQGRHLAVVSGREPVFVLRGAVVERLLRVFRGQPPE